jgi:hypothetical protein
VWTWHAFDLATGAYTGALALTEWQHEDKLNDSGQFSATLQSRSAMLNQLAAETTLPARSLIVPFRDGQPLGYAGIVWRSDLPTVEGSSLLSYFDTQVYDDTHVFTGVDQHLLVKALVDSVQTQPGGDIHVDTSRIVPSGVLRDQTWNIWEAKNVGDAIRQKGDNLGGYDFDFRVELDPGPIRRMRLWTPRRGRPYQPQASPVFTIGKNARAVPEAPTDGTEFATYVIALGQEIDSTTHERLRAVSDRSDLVAAGYPRLTKVLDLSDVKDLTTLQAHADGYATYHAAIAATTPELVLEVDPNDVTWPWGSYELGDDCMVVIPAPGQVSHDRVINEFVLSTGDGFVLGTGDGYVLGSSTHVIETDIEAAMLPWWPYGFSEIRRMTSFRWSDAATGERLQVVAGRMQETT